MLYHWYMVRSQGMKLDTQFLTPVKYLLIGQLMHMGLYFLAAPTCAVASYLSTEFINETL